MKKHLFKNLLVIFALVLGACSSTEEPGSSFFDQTQEAANLVGEANAQLRQIKQLFQKNAGWLEELKTAMNNKDEKKVKDISKELVYQINDGTKLGEEAIEKIERASQMNVNEDFKNYLSLKAQSLRKYADAFEERRNLARLLSERYDPKNAEQRDFVLEEFKRKEESFKRIIKEAQEVSERANELAKESLSKTKQ
jgi:vacuolar-type H+-ATPase subunit I/STV1